MCPMEGAIMEQRFRDSFFRTLVLASMYSELCCGLVVEEIGTRLVGTNYKSVLDA